jgi:hypothetical protein
MFVLTTVNCPALVPTVIPKAGGGSRGGRGRLWLPLLSAPGQLAG